MEIKANVVIKVAADEFYDMSLSIPTIINDSSPFEFKAKAKKGGVESTLLEVYYKSSNSYGVTVSPPKALLPGLSGIVESLDVSVIQKPTNDDLLEPYVVEALPESGAEATLPES